MASDREKKLLSVLKIDTKDFEKKLSTSQKNILKFSAATTAAGAAAFAAAKFTANYQDEIIKASRSAGVSAEAMSGYAVAAELSGVSTDQLVTALAKLNNITTSVEDGLNSFGIATKDANGEMKNSEVLLREMADTMQDMETVSERSALVLKVFGDEGRKMATFLSSGSEALDDFARQAEIFGLVVTEEAGLAAEKFNDDISRMGFALKGVRNSIGESIIAFINQSAIMDKISAGIATFIEFWRELDDGTKDLVLTLGAIATGLGLVLAGIVAFQLAAPAIGAAMTVALGPVGLTIAAIATAVAGLLALGDAASTYWSQVGSAAKPLQDRLNGISEASNEAATGVSKFLGELADDLQKVASWLFGVDTNMSKVQETVIETRGEISILGTVAKAVLRGISAAVIGVSLPFKILFNFLSEAVKGVGSLAKAMFHFISGDFKKANEAATAGGEHFKQSVLGANKIAADSMKELQDLFADDLTVYVEQKTLVQGISLMKDFGEAGKAAGETTQSFTADVADLTKSIERSNESVGAFKAGATGIAQVFTSAAGVIKSVADIGAQFASNIGKISESIAAGISRAAQVASNRIDKQISDLQATYATDRENFETSETDKISSLEKSYDDQIDLIRNREAQKNDLIERAAAERLLLSNNEFLALKAQREADFASFLEQESIKFEIDKNAILQRTADKEQAFIVDDLLENDFQNLTQQRQQDFDKSLLDLARQFSTEQAGISQDKNAALQESDKLAATKIAALEEEKRLKTEAAQLKLAQNLENMAIAFQAKQTALEKKQLDTQFKADMAAWKSTKDIRKTETIVAGVAAAAQGFAALAPIPVVGLALGAALAATILGATAASVRNIEQVQKPVKPAGLLEDGGVIGGTQTHARGGVMAEVEAGELWVDKGRTQKIQDFIDNTLTGSGGGGGMTFNFGPGSIIAPISDEEAAEKMVVLIADLLRRQGIIA